MNPDPLYAVHPGEGRDGRHLGFTALCTLYGIDPRRALNMNHPGHSAIAQYRANVIHLHPSPVGDYRLPV